MRKTFLLGGHSYTAPATIGAGVRARVVQITNDIADEKKFKGDDTEIIKRFWYDYSLRFLETLLTPEQGSPSVKEAYDSATDEEVQAVQGFFGESATDKIPSANGNTESSSGSKRTPKQKT